MSNAKLDEVLSAQKPNYGKTGLGYAVFSSPSFSTAFGSKTVFVPQSEKGDKGMKSKLIWLILNPLLDLMFVIIVVFMGTFVLIALSCILNSKCSNGHRFPLNELHLCLESY